MNKFRTPIFIIGLTFLALSCDWIFRPGPCDVSGPVIVYKTTRDYSNNVTVQLSKDGGKITAYPGRSDVLTQKPVELADGYLLKRMLGDAVLSITIEEYAASSLPFSPTDLFNLIIDKNPYLEKFECCECTAADTAAINDLIRKNQLSRCEDLK